MELELTHTYTTIYVFIIVIQKNTYLFICTETENYNFLNAVCEVENIERTVQITVKVIKHNAYKSNKI